MDCELLVRELKRSGFDLAFHRVDRAADFSSALSPDLDVIFCDYVMPDFSGLEALTLLNASGLDIPFIIISGTIGEETAVVAMQRGATDYLLKDRLGRLGQAVTSALEQKQFRIERAEVQRKLRESEERLRQIFDGISAMVMLCTPDGMILEVNRAALRSTTLTRDELIGRNLADQTRWAGTQDRRERLREALAAAGTGQPRNEVLEGVAIDGEGLVLDAAINPLRDSTGRVAQIVVSAIDVTQRHAAEQKIKEQLSELLRWQDVMLNREDRVQALKAEVNALLSRLGEPSRYAKTSLHD